MCVFRLAVCRYSNVGLTFSSNLLDFVHLLFLCRFNDYLWVLMAFFERFRMQYTLSLLIVSLFCGWLALVHLIFHLKDATWTEKKHTHNRTDIFSWRKTLHTVETQQNYTPKKSISSEVMCLVDHSKRNRERERACARLFRKQKIVIFMVIFFLLILSRWFLSYHVFFFLHSRETVVLGSYVHWYFSVTLIFDNSLKIYL